MKWASSHPLGVVRSYQVVCRSSGFLLPYTAKKDLETACSDIGCQHRVRSHGSHFTSSSSARSSGSSWCHSHPSSSLDSLIPSPVLLILLLLRRPAVCHHSCHRRGKKKDVAPYNFANRLAALDAASRCRRGPSSNEPRLAWCSRRDRP